MNESPIGDDPQTRVFVPDDLLPDDAVAAVLGEFRAAIPALFGEALSFAFVFGGFAKGYATCTQDVDCFVCLRHADVCATQRFREWYFDLHARYGLRPDFKDPGEVMTLSQLSDAARLAAEVEIAPVMSGYEVFEAIVWADILTGARAAEVGDGGELRRLLEEIEQLPQRWRRRILTFAPPQSDWLEFSKLPLTRLFRRTVRYEIG